MPNSALEDDFFTDADPGSCYDDGFINPAQILIPYIDADALEEYAGDIRRAGSDIGTAGEDIVTSWGGLSGVYQAPESEALLEAVDPVETDGESVATGTSGLASALEDFAEQVRHYKSRLGGLRDEAVEMRKVIDADEDWRDDEDLVEEHNALVLRVETAQLNWEAAQMDAANDITALFDGPEFVTVDEMDGDGHDGSQIPYGFSEIPEGQHMPWGGAAEVDEPWYVDTWNAGADIVTGVVQDFGGLTGIWHDGTWANPFFGAQGQENRTAYMSETLEGLALLTGFYDPAKADGDQWGVSSFGEWVDNVLPPLREVGQGIVPTDEWDDRPGYTITQGAINIGLIAGGAVLSFTGAGAVVGAPMAALGMRNGISALNDAGSGSYDVPDLRTPGVDVSRLPGMARPGSVPGGGAVPTTGVGAWFSGLLGDLRSSVGRLGQGQGPADPTAPPPRGPDSGDGANNGTDRSGDRGSDEVDTGATPDDVNRLVEGVEDHVRRNAHDRDAEFQVLNSRLGDDVFGDRREPALAGVTAGGSDSPGVTNAGGDLGGGAGSGAAAGGGGGGTSSSGDLGGPAQGSESSSPTTSGGSGGSVGPVIGGGGTSGTGGTGGDLGPPPPGAGPGGGGGGSGDGPGAPVHIGPDDPLMPGDNQRFGDGVDLDPNTRYEITDSQGRSSTYFTNGHGQINEIHTDARPQGSDHPELKQPRPDAKYVVRANSTEYTYYTDSNHRTVRAEGELTHGSHDRNDGEQKKVNTEAKEYFNELNNRINEQFKADNGRYPRPGEVQLWQTGNGLWNGGHLYGSSEFFGPGERLNQVAMLKEVNQRRVKNEGIDGSFRNAEMTWDALLKGEEHRLPEILGKGYNKVMEALGPALEAGPRPPKIETTINMIDDPNLKPIKIDGKTIYPPPASIEVNWTVNGVSQDQIDYPNIPKGPKP